VKASLGLIAATASMSIAAASVADAGRVTDGVLIVGHPQAARVALGQPIVVTGTLTNERAAKIALGTTDPLGGFRIILRDPHGRLLSPNKSGRDLIKLTHRSKQQLAPGENTQQSIWISSLYDLKKPGKYTVTITHAVPASGGIGNETVNSNPFTFVIVPK